VNTATDALNIYVPYGSEFGGAARDHGSNLTILKITALSESAAIHEIGHNLGLKHTRYPVPSEHATRIEFFQNGDPNPAFNAKTAGDWVVDTNANSGFHDFDEETDEIGDDYTINHEDVINVMGDVGPCRENYFSPGQINFMHETIATDVGLTPTVTDVASLYQPYKGEYYLNGTVPVDENGNLNHPLYQPGFSYNFISCDCITPPNDCSLPLDYLNTGFTYNEQIGTFIHKEETDYSIITHPNHNAIRIIELAESQPWRCYDNYNRKPNGGTIIKFNDNVLNTNVTITSQDSVSINNENLINNLEPGLYNIIEQFEDGDTEEQLIIKENN
jgi:hypothetical protein